MTIVYRYLSPEDVPVILELRQNTRENAMTLQELQDGYGINEASIMQALNTHARGWLCESDGVVVGFCIGNSSNGEVEVVAVLPEFEGQGIGRTLLNKVRDWLFSLGHREIWLLANPDPSVRASGFYERLGWKPVGTEHDQMVLTLTCNPGS